MVVRNSSGSITRHNITPRLTAVLEVKQSTLKYLPPCSTHLYQPTDIFIISKVKDAWTRRWEAKKTKLIATGAWQNNPRADGQWSGKLTNPNKCFFLQLVANSVQDVNQQLDCDNTMYARKTMIRSGLALNVDGTWNVHQLFPHLQKLVAKHPSHYGSCGMMRLVWRSHYIDSHIHVS